MKIQTIEYEELFPTGVYANQRYRAIGTLEDGDDFSTCFKELKDKVEKAFIELNPQINWAENNLPEITKSYIPTDLKLEERKVDYSLGITVDDINSCQDKSTLESYRLLVRNKPELEAAFLSKLKEFITT